MSEIYISKGTGGTFLRVDGEAVRATYRVGDVIQSLIDQVAEAKSQLEQSKKDSARLDALQDLSTDYGYGWILRESSMGRGMRLHETSRKGAKVDVRDAIDDYLNKPA